jgi:hypothetical protein
MRNGEIGNDEREEERVAARCGSRRLDFLSQEEARQAVKPVAALDHQERRRRLRNEPNSEKLLLAQHMSHASHG